jgi:hypothetical protein
LNVSQQTALAPRTAVAAGSSVAERLSTYARNDQLLREVLRPGHLRVGLGRVFPSRVDEAACMVARQLIREDIRSVAVAFPRGRGPQPGLFGLYLALWRHLLPGQLCGSVLVSTTQSEMSSLFREMMLDGAKFAKLTPGRIVGGTATVRPLDRSPRVRGISQADGFLLFARPNTLGCVAENVIWAMVVDTVGTAGPPPWAHASADLDSWTRTWTANSAAERKQLWIGELEDSEFTRFCAAHDIPLVTFDWPLIDRLSSDPDRNGVGRVTSVRLTDRARVRPPVSYRIVEDADRDYLAREVYALLGKFRRLAETGEEPRVVATAWKLCGLLSRLPCTRQAYDAATGSARFSESIERMWRTVDSAKSSAFVGHKWKDAYNRYWDPIRSALRKLIRLQEDEDTCSKYVALIERVGDAQAADERLRIVCQTNAERTAVKTALREFGVDAGQVSVHSFGARFPHGPERRGTRFVHTNGEHVTLLMGPPPPWRWSVLVTGEEGRVEVLCYRHELARLRTAVQDTERSHETENSAALNTLGFGEPRLGLPGDDEPVAPAELPGYGRRAEEPSDQWSGEVPPAESRLWEKLVARYGQELPEPDSTDDVEDTTAGVLSVPYNGMARLVHFTDAAPVFYRADVKVDVVRDGDDDGPGAVPIGELEEGMRIAFLPGGQRSLVEQVSAVYDERLFLETKMFEPLWERALALAVANVGIPGLAELTERTIAAVRSWVTGKNIPQQDWRFKRVLEASGDDEVLRAQVSLWDYLTATRGPHRVIGRLNRKAIAEVASDERDQPHLRDLERYVGRDLEDLYDQVELVTVLSVSSPVPVPLSHCGRPLPDDDPLLRSCT